MTATVLDTAGGWQIATDLEHLSFPAEAAVTAQRPDIVIWSRSVKSIIMVELTVPWEENIEVSHERKLSRYSGLVAQCRNNGWHCELFAVEVGARGFISSSMLSCLTRFGLSGRRIRKAARELSRAAEVGSAWIWNSVFVPPSPKYLRLGGRWVWSLD